MRALADPLRHQILHRLGRPATARALAQDLGVKGTKLYYHLAELERHGLVRVVERRTKRNLVEKVYQAVALSFRIDPALLHGGADRATALGHAAGLLETAALDLREATTEESETESKVAQAVYRRLRLPKAAFDELNAALDRTLRAAAESSSLEGSEEVALAVVLAALPSPGSAI